MAHSTDRNLVQSLGIETDHKTPDHDLACLYLQANARRLADKFLVQPKSTRKYSTQADKADIERLIVPHKLCQHCKFVDHYRYGATDPNLTVQITHESYGTIRDVHTRLERPVIKGEGKFQVHIGFIDLVVLGVLDGIVTNHAADLIVRRSCSVEKDDGPLYDENYFAQNNDWIHRNEVMLRKARKTRREDVHAANITLRLEERQHLKENFGSKKLAIKVKTCSVPLGDAIRQIKLYQAHYQADVWIFATTIPISVDYKNALDNESIKTLLISSEYKKMVQVQAEMDTL